jgi:hypothetical protein
VQKDSEEQADGPDLAPGHEQPDLLDSEWRPQYNRADPHKPDDSGRVEQCLRQQC